MATGLHRFLSNSALRKFVEKIRPSGTLNQQSWGCPKATNNALVCSPHLDHPALDYFTRKQSSSCIVLSLAWKAFCIP